MAETNRSTDELDEAFAELAERIDEGMRLAECLGKGCPLLAVIEEISQDAMRELVMADPEDRKGIIQRQQTAKLFDAIILSIKARLQAAEVAEREIRNMEEDDYGGKG